MVVTATASASCKRALVAEGEGMDLVVVVGGEYQAAAVTMEVLRWDAVVIAGFAHRCGERITHKAVNDCGQVRWDSRQVCPSHGCGEERI